MLGTLRRELLDRLLIVNEHHLRQVLTEYLQHYNTARPRRSLGQLTPAQAGTQPPDPVNLAEHWIHRKQVLGGLTREYYIAALPPSVATRERRSPHESYFRAPQDLSQVPIAHALDSDIAHQHRYHTSALTPATPDELTGPPTKPPAGCDAFSWTHRDALKWPHHESDMSDVARLEMAPPLGRSELPSWSVPFLGCCLIAGDETQVKVERPQRSEDVRP